MSKNTHICKNCNKDDINSDMNCSQNIYKNDRITILTKFIPKEIAEHIVKMTYTYYDCNFCKKSICQFHNKIVFEAYGNFGIYMINMCPECHDKNINLY